MLSPREVFESPGLGHREAGCGGCLVPTCFHVRENQVGDRGTWGVAPGTDGQAAWWLRPTEPDSGVTWSLNGGRGRITLGREARRGAGRELGVPGTTDVE